MVVASDFGFIVDWNSRLSLHRKFRMAGFFAQRFHDSWRYGSCGYFENFRRKIVCIVLRIVQRSCISDNHVGCTCSNFTPLSSQISFQRKRKIKFIPMNFLPQEIQEYALKNSDAESDILKKLNRETHLKMTMPQMLSGHLQGLMLQMFSKMIRPKNILEIGTFTGYSAICLASGLQEGGKLHTIDVNEEFKDLILRYIKESGMQSKIQLHIGPAVNIISTLKEEFDI